MNTTPIDCLEARGLELWRGDRCLFRNLDLRVVSGQLLHVQGANGSGKTSLLRVLTGLSTAEEGEVLWNTESTRTSRYAYNRALSYVGHQDGLHEDLTVMENLRWSVGLSAAVSTDGIETLLQQVGLARCVDDLCFGLSAGQRRRLALVRATLAGTRLWILDEPLANLDADARDWCQEQIAAHVAGDGLVVMTSHQEIDLVAGENLTLDMS